MILICFWRLVVRGGRARARGERTGGCPRARPSITRYIWDNLELPGISGILQRLSGSVLAGARRVGSTNITVSGISEDIWDRSAVVRERARGSAPRREYKYSCVSDYIWDMAAVVRERALGCPGAQPSITRYIWDNLALPAISGIWQRLSGSVLSVVRDRNLALPGISGIWQRLSGSAT